MPYCRGCGAKAADGVQNCAQCGGTEFVAQTAAPVVPSTPVLQAVGEKPRTSGLAIAALVLGILSLLTLGVLALPGLIVGIMAMRQTGKREHAPGGRGLAVTGVIISVVMFVFGTPALLFPIIMKSKEKPRVNTCLNNQRQIALAFSIYMSDNNERFPPADSNWPVVLLPYLGGNSALYDCPSTAARGNAIALDYGANNGVLGQNVADISDPGRTILTGDSVSPDFLLHTPADLDLGRHGRGGSVAFVDGSVDFLPAPPASLGP